MKPSIVVLAVGLAVLAAPARGEPGVGGTTSPFAAIRTLQTLQEQIAHGNKAAQAAQPKLMAHIADRLLATDPAAWREPRNARAAVLFVLSGGKPAVMRAVLAKATLPDGFDRLMKGALAYGEGDDAAARDLLGGIDPRGLPSVLGGHLALVQATLLSSEDNARANKLLDLARLLVPGTLVEEAALRRQIFMLTGPDALDKFAFLSREYIRRYRGSIYADNFKLRLTMMGARLASLGDVANLNKFDSILVELPTSEQLAFHLAIAKAALIQGKAAAARSSADKAATMAAEQSPDAIRSKLYAGAALVVSDNSATGRAMLESIDPAQLGAEDTELRDAALAVASGVQSEILQVGHNVDTGPAMVMPTDGPALETIDLARNAVASTDKLLQDAKP